MGKVKEHFDYDVLDFLKYGDNVNETPYESSDEYYLSDEVEELDYVDFHTEGNSVFGTHASARGRGRGSRGSRGGTDGRNGSDKGARGGRNRSTNRGPHLMDDDEIRVNLKHDYMQEVLKHDYMQEVLDAKEDKREHEEREHQERLDEEAFQEAMEQQSMYEQIDEERERQNREEREWEERNDYYNPSN
ncbi:hypothetical protein Tco_1143666 [Tanacetum coccineum]